MDFTMSWNNMKCLIVQGKSFKQQRPEGFLVSHAQFPSLVC